MAKDFKKQYDAYQKAYNQELNNIGVFYAFSTEQFKENQKPKDADIKDFLSIGYGGYIYKGNKDKLDEFFNKTENELKTKFKNSIDIKDLIDYELINHECYYTSDYLEILPIIKSYYDDKSDAELSKLIKDIYTKNIKDNGGK